MNKRLLALVLFSVTAAAADLDTDNYHVRITSECREGNVSCDQVLYEGTSKRSGNRITLAGRTWHGLCADGVTPCRFLGYRFDNGDVTYYVHESGLLEVVRDHKDVLVSEQGRWQP